MRGDLGQRHPRLAAVEPPPTEAPADVTRVFVVASHPMVRSSLVRLLAERGDIVLVGEAAGAGALDLAREPQVDVLILGLGGDSAELLEATRVAGEMRIPLLVIGQAPDADGSALASAGVGGYLLPDATPEQLSAAIRALSVGLVVTSASLAATATSEEASSPRKDPDDPLTDREMQVLQLVARGLPNKGIARRLGISEHTVKFHVGSILGKLEAASRTEAVTQAAHRGLLTL